MAIYSMNYINESFNNTNKLYDDYQLLRDYINETSNIVDYILNEKSYDMLLEAEGGNIFTRAIEGLKRAVKALVEWWKNAKKKIMEFITSKIKAIKSRFKKQKPISVESTKSKSESTEDESKPANEEDTKPESEDDESPDFDKRIKEFEDVRDRLNNLKTTKNDEKENKPAIKDKPKTKTEPAHTDKVDLTNNFKIDANYIINYAEEHGMDTFNYKKNGVMKITFGTSGRWSSPIVTQESRALVADMITDALSEVVGNSNYINGSAYMSTKYRNKNLLLNGDHLIEESKSYIEYLDEKIKKLQDEIFDLDANGFNKSGKDKETLEKDIEDYKKAIDTEKENMKTVLNVCTINTRVFDRICLQLPGIVDMIMKENNITDETPRKKYSPR